MPALRSCILIYLFYILLDVLLKLKLVQKGFRAVSKKKNRPAWRQVSSTYVVQGTAVLEELAFSICGPLPRQQS